VAVGLLALAAGAILVAVVLALSARRRAAAREARRIEELGRLAERLQVSLGELRPPSTAPTASDTATRGTPLVAGRLPGRTALLEAVTSDVQRAQESHARLTAVVVRAAGETTPPRLVDTIRAIAGRPAYAVGPGIAAFTLPELGRAAGLGVLARIEAVTASSGHAIEWDPRETAVELVARLLETAPRSIGG
jgi:hypothetical protein